MGRVITHVMVLCALAQAVCAGPSYTILVSERTASDPSWSQVVAALRAKYPESKTLTYTASVDEVASALSAHAPRFTCLVATPAEAGRKVVASMHAVTRSLDNDPYTDTRWGILTGYDASNALGIARHTEPLRVRDVLSGTPIPLDRCESGTWYSELEAGAIGRRVAGHEPSKDTGPADSTAALVAGLNREAADLFITSGHATERDWQIGYRYRNGSFRCEKGSIYGLDTSGNRHPVDSRRPRVYLAIGNCLMGHIDGPDCMALAFMNSAGVRQMIGYTVPTWFGYAGWGMLDYFFNQPGRYSMSESFIANQHALDHRSLTLASDHPDQRGLKFDRPVVGFFGDPAWDARMADGVLNWTQSLTQDGTKFVFEVRPSKGNDSFKLIDGNGSQRGGRPLVAFLPDRYPASRVIEGASWNPVVADDFVLIPLPEGNVPETIRVVVETGGV